MIDNGTINNPAEQAEDKTASLITTTVAPAVVDDKSVDTSSVAPQDNLQDNSVESPEVKTEVVGGNGDDQANAEDQPQTIDKAQEQPADPAEKYLVQDNAAQREYITRKLAGVPLSQEQKIEYLLAEEYARIFKTSPLNIKFALPALNQKFFGEEVSNEEALRRLEAMPQIERDKVLRKPSPFPESWRQTEIKQSNGNPPGMETKIGDRSILYCKIFWNNLKQIGLSLGQMASSGVVQDMSDVTFNDFAEKAIERRKQNEKKNNKILVENHKQLTEEAQDLRTKALGADYGDSSFGSDVELYGFDMAVRRRAASLSLMLTDVLRFLGESALLTPPGAIALESTHHGATKTRQLIAEGVDPDTAKLSGAGAGMIHAGTLWLFGKVVDGIAGGKFVQIVETIFPEFRAVGAKIGSKTFAGIAKNLRSVKMPRIFVSVPGVPTAIVKEAPYILRTYTGFVAKKTFVDFIQRVGGVTLTNAGISAIGQFIENSIDIALGIKNENQRWENVARAAWESIPWSLILGIKRYLQNDSPRQVQKITSSYEGINLTRYEKTARQISTRKLLEEAGFRDSPDKTWYDAPNAPVKTSRQISTRKLLEEAGFRDSPDKTWYDAPNAPVKTSSEKPLETTFREVMQGENPPPPSPKVLLQSGLDGRSADFWLDVADQNAVGEIIQAKIQAEAVGAPELPARIRLLKANGKTLTPDELVENISLPLTEIEKAQLHFIDRNGVLTHDPEETLAAIRILSTEYPYRNFYAVPNADALPSKIRNDAINQGKDPNDIRAAFTPDCIYVNTAKVRPSEVVRIVRNHELIWHDGIRRLLTPERRTELFNIVRNDVPDEIEEFALKAGYDPESERAVEEFMATRMEFEGNDPLKLFADNPDIAEFAKESGIDTSTDAGKIKATERYYDETGEHLPRVPWYEKVIAWFRDLLRSLKSSALAHFTDADYRRLFRKLSKAANSRKPTTVHNSTEEVIVANSADPDIRQTALIKHAQNHDEAREILKNISGKDIVNRDTGIPAQVNREQRSKLASKEAVSNSIKNGFTIQEHMTAVANIDSIYENAVLLLERKDLKNKQNDVIIRRFAAPVVVRGIVADALLTQKESLDKENGRRIYSLELTEIVSPKNIRGEMRLDLGSPAGTERHTHLDYLPEGINKLQHKHKKIKDFLEKIAKNTRFAVSPVYTGSAADYDQPSLQHVGSGEGAQVYGWGLYGSSAKDVAQWYAETVTKSKAEDDVLFDGKSSKELPHDGVPYDALSDVLVEKTVDKAIARIKKQSEDYRRRFLPQHMIDAALKRNDEKIRFLEENRDRIQYKPKGEIELVINGEKFVKGEPIGKADWERIMINYLFSDKGDVKKALEKVRQAIKKEVELLKNSKSDSDIFYHRSMLDDLKKVKDFLGDTSNKITYDDGVSGRRNLYQQTFWPGKQENLLDWDKNITEDQAKQILDALAVEGGQEVTNFVNREREADDNYDPEIGLEENYPEDVLRDHLERYLDFYEASGEYVYKQLSELFDSPKAASEFLYRAGIDGITYIGDDSGRRNYVAFSDQDIRVDEHIRYSADWVGEDQVLSEYAEYSDEARRMLVNAAKDWAAKNYLNATDAESLKFFQDNNLPVKSERVAHSLMHEAYRLIQVERAKMNARKAMDSYRENHPLFDFVMDFIGPNGYVDPGKRFEGLEVTGTFFAPEFRKYSFKRPQGKKESDASYRRYLNRRNDALSKTNGNDISEIAQAYVNQFGEKVYGDALNVEQAIFDMLKDLTHREIRHEYAKAKKDAEEQEKQMVMQWRKEQEANFAEEMRQLVQHIINNKDWRDSTWVKDSPARIKEMYHVLTGKKPPQEITEKMLDDLELAALAQKDGGEAFALIYSRIKEILGRQQDEKLKELFRKIREDQVNSRDLERAAKDYLFRNVPKGLREKFIGKIMALEKFSTRKSEQYPEGTRYAKFQELLKEMTDYAEEERRKVNLEALRTRLGQLHVQVDPTRKLVGRRDKTIQAEIDEILDVAELPAEAVNTRIEELQAQLDATTGDDVEIAARIANMATFGNIAGKSANELWNARKILDDIAATGRNRLLEKIEARRANDQADVDYIVQHLTGGKGVFDQPQREAATAIDSDKNWWQKIRDKGSIYPLLKLEDYIYLMSTNNTPIDWLMTPAGKIFEATHTANNNENTMLREYGDFRARMFGRFLGKEKANLVEAAGVIKKLRTREENPKVYRYYPTPENRTIGTIDFPVEQARAMLFAAGKEGKEVSGITTDGNEVKLNEFQTAILRQRLETLDARINRSYRKPEIDGSTEEVLRALDEREAKNKYTSVSVPTVNFTGNRMPIAGGLTQLEALYYHLMWQQSDQRYKLYYNGFTPETMQEIDKFLLPETKRLGQDMVDYLDKMGVKLSKLTEMLYYASMQKIDNYFPGIYDINKSQNIGANRGELDDPKTMQQAPGLVPGSIKMRNVHLREVKKCDALTVFENSILRNTHFIAFGEVARKMRAVLLDLQIKQALDQTFGDTFFPALKDAIIDTINGGKMNRASTIEQAMTAAYSNAVTVRMAFNIVSGMKQTVSWIANAQDVPVQAVFSGVARALINPAKMIRTLSETPYVKNRFEGGSDLWMKMILDRQNVSASKWNASVAIAKNFSSLFTRFGDMTAVMLGGYGVYRYHYNRMIKRGFSEAEAKEYALKRFEMTAESLQQSSAVHNRNAIQRGGLKFVTAWKSSQILQTQRLLREMVAMRHFGNTIGLKKDVKAYIDFLGKQGISDADRKAQLKFYKNFPLGTEIVTPYQEPVSFLPADDFAVNEYIHNFSKGVDIKTLEKVLKKPDDRILDPAGDIIYLAENEQGAVICRIDPDGRIIGGKQIDFDEVEKLKQQEIEAFERYGVEDADGNKLYLTNEEFLQAKSEKPLYLADDLAGQQGSSHRRYSGVETKGTRAGKALTTAMVISAISIAIGGITYLWGSAKKRKKLSAEEFSIESLISNINDYVAILPFGADIADAVLRRAIQHKRKSVGDKTMAAGDLINAIFAGFDISKHVSDQEWSKAADDAAEILMGFGWLRPEFQVGGSAIHRANEMYKLISGSEKKENKPKKKNFSPNPRPPRFNPKKRR